MEKFGDRLKRLRNKAGWFQRQLAEYSGVSTACICQLEAGRRLPSTDTARKLASALMVSIDELLGEPVAK